jgi:hypothetical protein
MTFMRLHFEDWLEEQKIKKEETGLFQEAVICYKAGAYRGSLLLSFLAFQKIIKNRVLQADKPDNIKHGQKWITIQSNLQKQEKWDEEVNKVIRTTDDQSRVFSISDDLRTQAAYWKDRRNDCAHAKGNLIQSAHVEAFWSFLESNLRFFEVGGSIEDLLNDIKVYLDHTYTAASEKPDPILHKIEKVIDEDNVHFFIDEFFNTHFDTAVNSFLFDLVHDKQLELLGEFIKAENEIFIRQFLKRLKEDEIIFLNLFYTNPKTLVAFKDDPRLIRAVWKGKNLSRPMNILMVLLQNNLLPEGEKKECFSHIITNYEINLTAVSKNELNKFLLQHQGFFTTFKEVVFYKKFSNLINVFKWANKSQNIESVIWYLKTFGLDDAIVKETNAIFQSSPYPNKMRERLENLFTSDEDLRNEFLDIAERLDLNVTDNLIKEEFKKEREPI